MNILLVDDDGTPAQATAVLLRRAGHAVQVLSDSEFVRSAVARFAPDLVITEWELPDPSGDIIVAMAGARKIPVIVYTAMPIYKGELAKGTTVVQKSDFKGLREAVAEKGEKKKRWQSMLSRA